MLSTDGIYFWWVIVLVLSALALTVYVFRQRMFGRGDGKGEAANPRKVRRENPPDR
jgi:cbb3-type cytochrome oxidase subunit 3